MTISTKYNISDRVYLYDYASNQIIVSWISSIHINEKKQILYGFEGLADWRPEEIVFPSDQEAKDFYLTTRHWEIVD